MTSTLNPIKRKQLETELDGKVNIWMDVRDAVSPLDITTKFLTVEDLSDQELFDLKFQINLGVESGSLTKQDRNELVATLDFDLK